MLRAALEAGARRIIFGVGGSASTDGGAGLLLAAGLPPDAAARRAEAGAGPDDLPPSVREQLRLGS